MDKAPFTMPGVYEVSDILCQGYWAVKIDLQNGKISIFWPRLDIPPSAFYHVAIDPDHTKYLSFVWNGRVYQFKVLCFGVTNAPFTFNRLGQQLRKFFGLRGVSIIIYIDDILVVSDSSDKCKMDAQLVIDKLVELGSTSSWRSVPCNQVKPSSS